MKKLMVLFLFIAFKVNAQYYVSPTGTGNGTFENPWSLQTALSMKAVIKPGETVWVRGGKYVGLFFNYLNGTPEKPIIVRPYNDEWVTIDGTLVGQSFKNKAVVTLNGTNTWFMEMEIMNSDPERTIPIAGSNPVERRGGGIDDFGPGNKIINCIIHDVGQGMSLWRPATNTEYYGNLVYNNGWFAPDRFHGHGIYTQNDIGSKTIANNIVLNNFSYGIHAYGSDQSALNNFNFESNVLIGGPNFNNHSLIGGGAPLKNINVSGNLLYWDRLQLGYQSKDNIDLKLTNNYFPHGLALYWWKNVTATGNWFFYKNIYSCPLNILFYGNPDLSTFKFDYNHYYWSYPGPAYPLDLSFCWKNTITDQENLFLRPGWNAAGQDLNATVDTMAKKSSTEFVLSGKKIYVTKNKYNSNKATIVIYNWDNSNTVDVDIDSVLNIGDTYELHGVQDYFNDIIKGTYTGKLTIPMTGRKVAKPIGYPDAIQPAFTTEYGAFMLVRTSLSQDTTVRPPVDTTMKPPVDTVVKPPVDTTVKPPVDTIKPVPCNCHDTVKVTVIKPVHDTVTITKPPVHDTTIITKVVHDTVKISVPCAPGMVDTVGLILNYRPIANAGLDTVILGSTATLSGTATDRDGKIVTVKWVKISGPNTGDFIRYPNQLRTDILQMGRGVYIYELQVTDDKNGTGIDRVTITKN